MKWMIRFFVGCLIIGSSCQMAYKTRSTIPGKSPERLYESLLHDVQMARVFAGGKTFVDCIPKITPQAIVAAYEKQKKKPNFDLKAFVLEHFEMPPQPATGFISDPSRAPIEHIETLWPLLSRAPHTATDTALVGTLIRLPYPYVVPGGRFREIYYWDSYFTMLGLASGGHVTEVENMVKNFAYIINGIGFIPNGSRTYFLTRSQPPHFSLMVSLLADLKGNDVWATYLPALEKEYAFWMNGKQDVTAANPEKYKVVRMPDGALYFLKNKSSKDPTQPFNEPNMPPIA